MNELGSVLRSLNGPVLVTGHTGFKGTWLTLLLESLGVDTVGFSLEAEKNSLFSIYASRSFFILRSKG